MFSLDIVLMDFPINKPSFMCNCRTNRLDHSTLNFSRVSVMALVESEVAFKKRCEELETGLFDKFKGQDIASFSTLAFTLGSPQNPVADDQLNGLADKIFGGVATVGNAALVRRLHFEACTFLMADMKTQVSATDPSEPVRKLPFVEKQTRLESQKRRISGLLHKTEQQPSHQLIDQVYNMVESGAVLYIHPSKCHSRDHEIQCESKQKSKQILTWEQGALKSTVSNALSDIDTGTELKLYFALQRRHLAFLLVNFLSWDICQVWLDKLMTTLVTDSPAQFAPVSVTQILKADREMFSLLAAEHSEPLKALPGSPPPLDALFTRLMHDPRINVHLIAYPKHTVPKPSGNKREGDDSAEKPVPKKPKLPAPKPVDQMPDELKGLKTKTSDGKPICWHYNMKKKCNNSVKNGRCRFGFHLCMRCSQKNHGAADCPS